jgi:hypothetical protein
MVEEACALPPVAHAARRADFFAAIATLEAADAVDAAKADAAKADAAKADAAETAVVGEEEEEDEDEE